MKQFRAAGRRALLPAVAVLLQALVLLLGGIVIADECVEWTNSATWTATSGGVHLPGCNDATAASNRSRTDPAVSMRDGKVTHLFIGPQVKTAKGVSNLPDNWSGFQQLQDLRVINDGLGGTLPAAWSVLTNLEHLEIRSGASVVSGNLMTALPPEWSTLTKLTYLGVFNYTAGSTIGQDIGMDDKPEDGVKPTRLPAVWSRLVNLKAMELVYMGTAGPLPKQWSALSGLTRLLIKSRFLDGPLPKEWRGLQSLVHLDLSRAHGQLASYSYNLQSFSWKHEGNLTGPLPKEWAALTLLSHLDLQCHALSGTLPASWTTLKRLRYLDLEMNRLTGRLEQEVLTNMESLQLLNLRSNGLGGPLPAQLPPSLQMLALSDNWFQSSLPREWGSSMKNLRDLRLELNKLSSSLPPEWSGLTKLTTMDVSNNELTGTIPDSWTGLAPRIQYMELAHQSKDGNKSLCNASVPPPLVRAVFQRWLAGTDVGLLVQQPGQLSDRRVDCEPQTSMSVALHPASGGSSWLVRACMVAAAVMAAIAGLL